MPRKPARTHELLRVHIRGRRRRWTTAVSLAFGLAVFTNGAVFVVALDGLEALRVAVERVIGRTSEARSTSTSAPSSGPATTRGTTARNTEVKR